MDEPTDPALARELRARADADQAARRALAESLGPDGLHHDDEAAEQMRRVDEENTAWMREILDRNGWPGWSLVGEAADAAWLLCQHADRDPVLQRRALHLLEEAVARGDAGHSDLAYLTDRVAVNEGRPQRYGTQFVPLDGVYVPRPIEDPEAVDKRRAAIGLEPLAEYARGFPTPRRPEDEPAGGQRRGPRVLRPPRLRARRRRGASAAPGLSHYRTQR